MFETGVSACDQMIEIHLSDNIDCTADLVQKIRYNEL